MISIPHSELFTRPHRQSLQVTTTNAAPSPLAPLHRLKLLDKRILDLLVTSPRLAHLLHAEGSYNCKAHSAERRPLLADGGVGRDADCLEELEIGGVAVTSGQYVFSCFIVSRVDSSGSPFVVHVNLHQEPALRPHQALPEPFLPLATSAEERDLLG